MVNTRIRFLISVAVLFLGSGPVAASMLPVFRYALENWHPATYELAVVYRNELTDEETAVVEWLEKNSRDQLPYANYTLRMYDLASGDGADLSELGGGFVPETVPSFVLLTSPEREQYTIVCQGQLTFEAAKTLINSPAREEIAKRILDGDSAVWLLIESGNTLRDDAAGEILNDGLAQMNRIFAPQESGTGDTNTLPSDMPVSFSSLRISRKDPLEIYTIHMLLEGESASLDPLHPLVVPVFGRGRALGIYRGDTLDPVTIREVGSYLIGSCVEESKELNPGYDLLILSDWDSGITDTWFVTIPARSLVQRFPITAVTSIFVLAILIISLTVNARHIFSTPRKACVRCQKGGFFTSLNNVGLCSTCASDIYKEMDAIGNKIQNAIMLLGKSKNNAESQQLCSLIVQKASEAMKYEKMGILFPKVKPADLIEQYSAKLVILRMESEPGKVNKALTTARTALQPYRDIRYLEDAIRSIVSVEEVIRNVGSATRIIAFINQKGGVGKTTSTINIGAGLAKLKKNVLLIDFDPQANLTDGLGIIEEKLKYSIYDFIKNKMDPREVIIRKHGLSIIPSHMMLTRIEQECRNRPQCNNILREALEGIDGYDYVLIDCPPTIGFLTLNALNAAKDIYIPFIPEYFALKGIRKTLDIIEYIKKSGNKNLTMRGLIGTRYDGRKLLHQESVEMVEKSFGDKLYCIIREDIALSEASSFGKSIFDYQPDSSGAEDYMGFCRKILSQTAEPVPTVSVG